MPTIIVVLEARPFYRCEMVEVSETNRPGNPRFAADRNASARALEGLAKSVRADGLLGAILASERENPVLEEVIGTLAAVDDEKITIDVKRRFEIQAENVPGSLRRAIGKTVGVLVMDGQIRWRLVEAAPEPGEGEFP